MQQIKMAAALLSLNAILRDRCTILTAFDHESFDRVFFMLLSKLYHDFNTFLSFIFEGILAGFLQDLSSLCRILLAFFKDSFDWFPNSIARILTTFS